MSKTASAMQKTSPPRPRPLPADNLVVTASPDEPVVIFTRLFDAPRALVWEAVTEARHIERWWGPKSRTPTTKVVQLDLRVGGAWRYESTTPDGRVIVFRGRYLEIEPQRKLVYTFGVEGMFDGNEGRESLVLEESGARTRCISTGYFSSFEERDGVLATGMAEGGRESYNQLAELLAELSAG